MKRIYAFLIAASLCLPSFGAMAWWQSIQQVAVSTGGGCSQATTFLARTSGLSGTESSAYTTMICGMVTDGTWSLFDLLYVYATNTQATAGLNLVSTSFTHTVNGTPTFTADQGYTGVAGAFLDTGWTASTNAVNMTLNSATFGVCDLTNRTATASGILTGVQGSAGSILLAPLRNSTTTATIELNGNSFQDASTGIAQTQGSWIISRTASTGLTLYNNGTSVGTVSDTSTALPNSNLIVLGYNAGGAGNLTTDQLGYLFAGNLTPTQISSVYSRLHTFMTAVGASGC